MWQDLFKHEKKIQIDKNLLYVLAPNQDEHRVHNPFSAALEEISEHMNVKRAEIELKHMVRQLMVMTGGAVYSPLMLSTIGLPYPVSIVLWVTATLLEDAPSKQIERFVEKRTHDSVKLLRSLNEYRQFLSEWWQTSVTLIPVSALPETLQFPVGHPMPPRLYHQHPLSSKPDHYYPVNAYYSLLYKEREQELIQLLADLGATQILIQPLVPRHDTENQLIQFSDEMPSDTVPRVFQYRGHPISSVHFDASQYEWLPQEPSWQAVVESRVNHACLSASLEISLDIANTVAALLDGIESLSEQLTSVQALNVDALRDRTLKKQFVQVEFEAG